MDKVVRLEYAYGVCPKCKCVHYLRYLIHNDGLIHKPYEIKCINCNSYFAKEDILGSGEETAPKPITNADRIRSMTDEELATLLTDVAKKSAEKLCESLKTVDVDLSNCDFDILYKAHLDWLRQEVTDG